MLSLFEKLINEHGSSAILKERLTILKDMYSEIENSKSELESKCATLKLELDQQKSRADSLEKELDRLNSGVFSKYACDHCGSPNLKRIGNRPDPTFGIAGVKQFIFQCDECKKESAFIDE